MDDLAMSGIYINMVFVLEGLFFFGLVNLILLHMCYFA